MSKEARALLKKINDKKNAIRGLQGQGKTKEMQEAMGELRDMQEQFNILMELDEEDDEGIQKALNKGQAKKIEDGDPDVKKTFTKAQIARAFVNRIVCGLRRTVMPEQDQEIMDAVTEEESSNGIGMNEGSDEDGGFTVPQDIRTDINYLRRTENDLEQYVNVEPVRTLSGSRVFEVDADSTPWDDVDEGGQFPEEETPKLRQIKYKIGKKGGIMKTTRELLQDTAENILGFLNRWIAKKSRATRNAAILKKLDEITEGKEVPMTGFDDFKDVFNETLDPAIAASSIVLTNQSGFNYIDKLKDEKGNYILQPDVTDKSKHLLFGIYPVHKVSNKTLKNTQQAKGGTGEDKDVIVSEKYPFFIGDLKEAVTLFDREKITIELSTEAGDLWARDLTGIKVRDRFDVQAVDTEAIVKCEVTVDIAG